MMAWIRFEGGRRSHTWPIEDYGEQDGADVVVDGHRIEGAELLRVESMATYTNGGEPPGAQETDSLMSKLVGLLTWGTGVSKA